MEAQNRMAGTRRWMQLVLLLPVVLGAAVIVDRRVEAGGGSGVDLHRVALSTAGSVHVPPVNVAAFRGQGHLAFRWSGQLYVLDGDAGVLRHLTRAGQVGIPAWSRDGSHLLYIRDDAVWLIGMNGTAPARIAGPFTTKPEYFGYYGQVSWPHYIALAWYRR
jgi:hypothetical protein